MLLAEVARFAIGRPLVPPAAQSARLPEAVGQLVRRVGTGAHAIEQPFRTILRLSLDPSTGVRRPGHRVEWIAETLAPARNKIDSGTFSKLSKALTLMLGIDPIMVMKDIAGATQEQALDARMVRPDARRSSPRGKSIIAPPRPKTARGKGGPLRPYFGVSVDSTR
jgi:hypothetical protein